MSKFKGTKDKYNTSSTWGVYYSRMIGTMDIEDITVMPKGNHNGDQHIAKCWDRREVGRNGGLTYEEAKYNALLISKAPEMLAILEECLSFIEELKEHGIRDWSEEGKLRNLIKEATEL